jgi:hypothetical protein
MIGLHKLACHFSAVQHCMQPSSYLDSLFISVADYDDDDEGCFVMLTT